MGSDADGGRKKDGRHNLKYFLSIYYVCGRALPRVQIYFNIIRGPYEINLDAKQIHEIRLCLDYKAQICYHFLKGVATSQSTKT